MEVTGRKLESENISVLFCELCEVENSKTSANGACRECKEYMCVTCFQHHLKSKLSRNHVLLSLEEFSSLTLDCGAEDVIKCKKHDDEIIKFYCRSHDVVGCGACIVIEHTSCKPEYIKDLAKTFTDGDVYKSIVKRVEDLRKKKSDCEQEIEKGKEEIRKMNEKALKNIREFRREINTCFDEAEANILSEMKKMTMENTGQLEKIEKGLQSLTSELQTMTLLLNTQLHNGNALFINAVNCKSKLTDLETMYENTTKEKALKEFEFVQNNHMSELLKAAEPLGSMKTKHEINSMMSGSMMDWRCRHFDMRGPSPSVMRGPYSAMMRGPSPPVMRGPYSAMMRGPSPPVMRGPYSAMMRESSPPVMRGPYSAMMRGPSPTVMRGPYSAMMRDSSSAGMRKSSSAGMRGSSSAGMRGSSSAGMRGSSSAGMRGSSSAGMRGSSSAGMRGSYPPVMNEQEFMVGSRVRLGPDWECEHEDGGEPGTIIGFDFDGFAEVEWDSGYTDAYRVGQDNSYELEIIY